MRASLLRGLVLTFLVVVLTAGTVAAGGSILEATGRQSVTITYSMKVGGTTRSYETIAPVAPLPKSAPIIVVLGGISAPVSDEISRDRLVPYANGDMAELVYPVGIHESWNAVGCCGYAAAKHVNDIGFLKALAPRIDPGHAHPLDIVGYSNGGRMAYRMACTDPGLFDQTAIVKADPLPGCVVTDPQTILQVASLDDYAVPYKPGIKGKETPPATVQVSRLRAADKCSGTGDSSQPGKTLRYTVWNDCTNGTRVGFAVYSVGAHNFPPPSSTQPAAATVIWAFFNHQSLSA
jgi:polyhydroxybutyrate depolymerase